MRPAEGTRLFFVDDQGVLFDEPAQRLFHLNTTTAFIWCLLEEDKDRPSIVEALQETFGLSGAEASDYLDKAHTILKGLKVLDASDRDFAPIEPEDSGTIVVYSDEQFVAERRYRLLSSNIRLRFSDTQQLNWIAPVLDHLLDPDPPPPNEFIDVFRDDAGRFRLSRDGKVIFECGDYGELAPFVNALVWVAGIKGHDFFLDIHAGVVGDGDGAFLLPAGSGSGKSTFTAALVGSGFEYFSDEVALMDESMQVTPFPLALCVKDSGTDALSSYYPLLPDLPLHLRADTKRARYLPPPVGSVPRHGTTRPIKAIVFPRYRAGAEARLEALGKLDALTAFLSECVVVDTRLDPDKVERLIDWFGQVPCYRLEFADLGRAIDLFRGIGRADQVSIDLTNAVRID